MTEPDEALLWAREYVAGLCEESDDPKGAELYRSGQYDDLIDYTPEAYRAGQAASAERIKALEEALRDVLPNLKNCFAHHGWHTERPPEPDYIVIIRNLLKEADQ
jgi:glycine/D-amino acid oxidase-like deaminating enzyme